jgi:hypothetical protein
MRTRKGVQLFKRARYFFTYLFFLFLFSFYFLFFTSFPFLFHLNVLHMKFYFCFKF